jgi:cell fate regulator YaaT (PSP1 superfamily)
MPMMCAVAFSPRGKLYYADPGPLTPKVGDRVLVPTDDGDEVATCMWAPQWVSADIGELPVLTGLAADADVRRDQASRRRRAQARVAAKRLVREHGLPMKIVGVDHVSASDTFTIYFSAEGRVDFRALVRDLNRTLDTRVHLRQLSARDSAKIQGGIGSCGRELCCSTFLTDFEPVSIRMAKDQNLALNPLKISGACGRLMCCLRYEHPLYEEFAAAVPAVGARARTPDGPGRVISHDVPRQQIVVALDAGGRRACDRADVCSSRRAHEAAYPAASGGCGSDLASTTADAADQADGPSTNPPADAAAGAGLTAPARPGEPAAPARSGPTTERDGATPADAAPARSDPGTDTASPTHEAERGHHRIRRRRPHPGDGG